ncbi:MAG TPA: GH25 family lysozyme [Planctomycetota bacterium]|nr:GH25 family lysozyme [Planctomycetota bacterium]
MVSTKYLASLALAGVVIVPGCGGARPASPEVAVAAAEATEPEEEISARNIGAGLRAGDESVPAPIALPPAPETDVDVPDQRSGLMGFGASGGGTARGIDVSEYQGAIDWSRVHSSGIVFAIARVSDGFYHDPYFQRNWSGMKAAGVIRGAYQFFRPDRDPVSQADDFLAQFSMAKGDLPPMLDVEVTDGVSNGTLASRVGAWIDHVRAKTGRKVLVYASPGFWNGHGLGGYAGADMVVAHWGVASPQIPHGFSTWTFWQYADNTTVPGISGRVDGDYFHGTLADLQAYAGGSPAPAPTSGGSNPSTYTVQRGDTLSGIAARFGVSLAALEAANPQITNPNLIYPGQVLNLPGGGKSATPPPSSPPPSSPPPAANKTYTVQKGDTLSGIAARFGVSLNALEAANPQITNPNLIYPGQVITIPGGSGGGGGGGGSNAIPDSDKAIAFAASNPINPNTHDHDWSFYCLALVGDSWIHAGHGDGEFFRYDARLSFDAFHATSVVHDIDRDPPPRGAVLYWDSVINGTNYGHTAISNGDGTCVTNCSWGRGYGGGTINLRYPISGFNYLHKLGWINPVTRK